MSFDVILPFLRPIAHLILDPEVSEIMVNGSGRVFIEQAGRLEEVTGVVVQERSLQVSVSTFSDGASAKVIDGPPA